MDDLTTARSRAVLARIEVLRLERRTRDAQALWASARSGRLPEIDFAPEAAANTTAAVLVENAAIIEALLLMRQDDDERYAQALEILDAVRDRLLGADGSEPTVSGERQHRLLGRLSVAYSQAGREDEAAALVERMLGVPAKRAGTWQGWGLKQIKRVVEDVPDIRAADQLGNLSTRATRLASLHILAGTPESLAGAGRLARIAVDTATVSLEHRHTPLGIQISRRALLGAELHLARLLPPGVERMQCLRELSAEIWQLVVDSNELADNGPSTLMSRHALFGQTLLDQVVLGDVAVPENHAWLARVALRPMAEIQELDAVYDVAVGVAYGDACSVTGDAMRARRSWATVLRRLRRARRDLADAANALELRLATGVPPHL